MSKFDNPFLYLVCLYIIVMPILPSKFAIGRVPINGDIILVIIFAIYLIKVIVLKNSRHRFVLGIKNFFKDYLSIFMLIYIFMLCFSISYSMDKKLAIQEDIRFISYFALFFIIKYEINLSKAIDKLLYCYVFVCGIVFTYGIADFINTNLHSSMHNVLSNRISSTLENSNNLGIFAIIAIFPFIMLAINETRKKIKILFLILTLLALGNIIISFSRNAWIGLIIGCLVLIVLYSPKFAKLFILLAGILVLIKPIRIRLLQITDMSQNITRIKLWETAGYMIKDHSLLGVGSGNFRAFYPQYTKLHPELLKDIVQTPYFHPHNVFLKVQCELGIIGTFAFGGLMVSIIIKLKEFIRKYEDPFYNAFFKGFLISVIVFLIMNLIDDFFSAPKVAVFFWILIAISQSLIYNVDKNQINCYNSK